MKTAIIIFLILLFNSAYSQCIVSTDIKGSTVDHFIELEKKLGSKKIEPESEYIYNNGYAQPLIFKRKENGVPDLLVFYKFYEKDSMVGEIEYQWDVSNFNKTDNNKQPLSLQKLMIKKYEELYNMISKKFGKSEQEGNITNLNNINKQGGLNRRDSWKNDSPTIVSNIILSNYYEHSGIITSNPTNRIRLSVINIINKNKIHFLR